jgi:HEXXH motif-containing protein
MPLNTELSATEPIELCAGEGGADAATTLQALRLRRTVLLLRYICRQWPGEGRRRDDAVALLEAARSRSPEVVTDLFLEPHLGAWAAWLSRRLRGTYEPGSPIELDLAYLAGVAAVAAWRTGISAEVETIAGPGGVFLPTIGLLRGVTPGRVTLRVDPSGIGVAGSAHTSGPDLLALRWLTVGEPPLRLRFAVDDLDPYRGRYHVPPTDRLDDDEIALWQADLDRAWRLLTEHSPGRAEELVAGLRTLVPLRSGGPGVASSATAVDAFGAVGLTLPPTVPDLAVTLVHEFQHSKLSALTDIVSLHDIEHTGRYFAPWRNDPRPVGGLVQGIYAFLGIAETWHQLVAAPTVGEMGLRYLAEIREQVEVALSTLETSGALTVDGARFAVALRVRLDRLHAIAVPADHVAQARTALRENHREWQRRNDRFDPL